MLFSGATVASAELMKTIIDAFSDPRPYHRWLIPLIIVLLFIARGIGGFIGNYGLARVTHCLVYDLRAAIFETLLKLPTAYYDSHPAGHLISMVTFHVSQVTGAATRAVKIVLQEGFFVVGILGYLAWTNWRLSLVLLVLAPPIGWIVRYAGRRFRKASQRIQGSMGEVTHVTAEAINGFKEIRTFGGTEKERLRFGQANNFNRQQSMKLETTQAISSPAIQIIMALGIGTLVWLALSPSIMREMTPGAFVAYITAASLLAKPVRQLSNVQSVVQRGLAAAEEIFSLLDQEPEANDGTSRLGRAQGKVEFEGVSFSYPTSQKAVLTNINFTVQPGESIALVGRSGSGKSTLVSLLPRFYNYVEGQIRLDGIELRDFALEDLRRQIGLVSQQVTLFNDSIRNNIAFGELEGASDEAVREAAHKAHALEFIESLPDRFDTRVGDDGMMLSGGQRQRIAIARVLLKDARVLILDEATSALDTESEQHIQAAFEEAMRGRTTFVIAHRLSTIVNADRILVVDAGRIVETGRHQELVAQGGLYAELYRRQFAETGSAAAGGSA